MLRVSIVLLLVSFSWALGGVLLQEEKPFSRGRLVSNLPIDPVKDSEVPIRYQASVQYFQYHICGGSVLSATAVVTAASCVYGDSPFTLSVRAGSPNWNFGGLFSVVHSLVAHPGYNPTYGNPRSDYDVAVLRVSGLLVDSGYIQPITLPAQGSVIAAGASLLASGWGTLRTGPTTIDTDRYDIALNSVDFDTCYNIFEGKVTPRMGCSALAGQTACGIDAGAALVYDNQLYGIVSWGYDCNSANFLGVHTNVTHKDILEFVRQAANL